MSSKVFFTADTHFGDAAIIRYENRPFANTAEMDAALIHRWNEVVTADDTVFVLGDFSAYGTEKTAEICARLNGRKILVMGNHDTEDIGAYLRCGFSEVSRYPIVYENFWILSHEPMYVNTNMPYANLFGHVHANPIYADCSPQSFCVSVERTGYAPVAFSEIKRKIAAQCAPKAE